MMVSAVLIASGFVAMSAQPANATNWACQYFPFMCSSGFIPGGSAGGGGNPGGPPPPPPPPPDPPRTGNPAFTWSGTAYFDNPYGNTHYNAVRRDPSPLPGARGAFTAHDGRGGTVWVRGNGDNHYRGQCKTNVRTIWNPVTSSVETYYPYGVRWVDRMFWGDDGNSWRSVSYTCLWPGAPRPVLKTCAYWGAGELQGPLLNSKGLPVMTSEGSAMTRTLPREWTAPRTLTALGRTYESRGKQARLGMGDAEFARYVSANCSDFDYLGWFETERCTLLYGGGALSGDDCTVVPGNYRNKFRGQQLRCGWTYYPYWNVYRAAGCTTKAPLRQNLPYALYCDDSFAPRWDTRYNFATCGDSFAPPRCNFTGFQGRAPEVITPNGRTTSLSTQMLADGRQWQLNYSPIVVPEAENKRQQWILADNSQPAKNGSAGAENQPYLAHYNPSDTGRGILKRADSNSAIPGWDENSLYLRVFKAGGVSDDGPRVVGQGEVSNPARVGTMEHIPLGIYARYLFTVKRTVSTEVGGVMEIDVPMTCTSSMATFYAISGRAID